MAHGKFGTAINCIDGRVQLPLINWMKEQYRLDFVDMITEPGADKVTATGTYNQMEAIKQKLLISVEKHGSKVIIIAGHDDCAGNPVTPEQHKEHLRKAQEKVLAWHLPVDRVAAVWINNDWRVELISSK